MTPDRGPDGRSLGHSHVEHVQPPNRGYAGYYLPNLYQENYRIRTAEELDALPYGSVLLGIHPDGEAWAYTKSDTDRPGWNWNGRHLTSCGADLLAEVGDDSDEWLFVVYRPDMVAPRRDPA